MLLGHSNSVEVALSGQQIQFRLSTLLSSSSSLLEKNGSAEAPYIKFHSLEHAKALSILSDFGILFSNFDGNSKFVPPDFPPRDFSDLGPIKRQIKYLPKAFISTERFLTIEGDSILQVSTQDEVLLRFGSNGFENGQFNDPKDLCYDSQKQRIIVCDTGNSRLQVFDQKGSFLFKIGPQSFGNGYFECPSSVTVDRKGNIYVSDSGHDELQVFSEKGRWMRTIKEIVDPYYDKNFRWLRDAIAVLSNGNSIVGVRYSSSFPSWYRIAVVGAKGDLIQLFGYKKPCDKILLDPHENIWVFYDGSYYVYTQEGYERARGTVPNYCSESRQSPIFDPMGNLYCGCPGNVVVV